MDDELLDVRNSVEAPLQLDVPNILEITLQLDTITRNAVISACMQSDPWHLAKGAIGRDGLEHSAATQPSG